MECNIITSTGIKPPVLTLNGNVAITHFESDNRQLFETEEGSFVYKKDTQEIHRLSLDSYTKLLNKLNTFIDDIKFVRTNKT